MGRLRRWADSGGGQTQKVGRLRRWADSEGRAISPKAPCYVQPARRSEPYLGRVGCFLRKRRGHVRAERTRSLPGGGRPRWAAKAGPGGGRRVGGPGLQGDVAGWWCAVGPVPSPGGQRLPVWLDQRAAWNSSRLGVRTARRSNSLSVVSLPMALTRSRTDSGTWSNRVSRTSIIASRAFWMRPFSRPS